MSQHRYATQYFAKPRLATTIADSFISHLVATITRDINEQAVDAHTLLALTGTESLYGITKLSPVVKLIEDAVPGRLLVFFPGQYHEPRYRFLDAGGRLELSRDPDCAGQRKGTLMTTTLLNRDVFARNPVEASLQNDGVSKVDNKLALRYELETFVCEGEYEQGLLRILETYLGHLSQPTQPSAWVSGFYGSGKSHLVKILEALWRNEPFADGVKPARHCSPCAGDHGTAPPALQRGQARGRALVRRRDVVGVARPERADAPARHRLQGRGALQRLRAGALPALGAGAGLGRGDQGPRSPPPGTTRRKSSTIISSPRSSAMPSTSCRAAGQPMPRPPRSAGTRSSTAPTSRSTRWSRPCGKSCGCNQPRAGASP